MTDVWTALLAGLPIVVATLLAVVEVVTRPDLGTFRRLVWMVALVAVPVVGVAVYAIVRPLRQSGTPVHDVDGSQDAERLVLAAERRQRGEIDDAEFRAAVAEIRP